MSSISKSIQQEIAKLEEEIRHHEEVLRKKKSQLNILLDYMQESDDTTPSIDLSEESMMSLSQSILDGNQILTSRLGNASHMDISMTVKSGEEYKQAYKFLRDMLMDLNKPNKYVSMMNSNPHNSEINRLMKYHKIDDIISFSKRHYGYLVDVGLENPNKRILHITNLGDHTPINSIFYAKNDIETIEPSLDTFSLDRYEVIVLSTIWGINKQTMDFISEKLAEFVENGGHLVMVYYPNSENNMNPIGNFASYRPLLFKSEKPFHESLRKLHICEKAHPLLDGIYNDDVLSMCPNRFECKPLNDGDVSIVARYADGVPLITMRNDTKGSVISLNYHCGKTQITVKGIRVLNNCIRYRKYNN